MGEQPYDSTLDTLRHQRRVDELLLQVITALQARLGQHDASKMEPPEKETFDRVTPKLAELTYGTDEYRAALADMGDALAHHYAENRHHPDHFSDGVRGMTLVDVVEMLCDWRAATERHDDGDLVASLPINAKRFDYRGEALEAILGNTAEALGWTDYTIRHTHREEPDGG